jgi:hypothetical protein
MRPAIRASPRQVPWPSAIRYSVDLREVDVHCARWTRTRLARAAPHRASHQLVTLGVRVYTYPESLPHGVEAMTIEARFPQFVSTLLLVALYSLAFTASAATDNACMQRCTNSGSTYAYCQNLCTYSSESRYPLPQLVTPNIAESFNRGMREAQAARQRQAEIDATTELADAQRRLLDEQAHAQHLDNERRERSDQAIDNDSVEDARQRWLAAAMPRVSRFPDFNSTVFADDVDISAPMIEWMSRSKYAADIAYYLGKHKDIATLISQQVPSGMATSLAAIEAEIASADQN